MTDKLVRTPNGPGLQSKTHSVPKGHVLDLSEGRVRERDADGNVVADYGPVPEEPAKGAPDRSEDRRASPKEHR